MFCMTLRSLLSSFRNGNMLWGQSIQEALDCPCGCPLCKMLMGLRGCGTLKSFFNEWIRLGKRWHWLAVGLLEMHPPWFVARGSLEICGKTRKNCKKERREGKRLIKQNNRCPIEKDNATLRKVNHTWYTVGNHVGVSLEWTQQKAAVDVPEKLISKGVQRFAWDLYAVFVVYVNRYDSTQNGVQAILYETLRTSNLSYYEIMHGRELRVNVLCDKDFRNKWLRELTLM